MPPPRGDMQRPEERPLPSGPETHARPRLTPGHTQNQAESTASAQAIGSLPGEIPSRLPAALPHLQKRTSGLRLRSKFLLSLVLIIVAMTAGTLLVVRQSMQAQSDRQIEEDGRNSLLTFQVMEQQKRLGLSRRAELLATLAFMRNGDPTTIQDASDDPWQSDECDLFALADRKGKITALRTRSDQFSATSSSKTLGGLVRQGQAQGWWLDEGRIYQVVVEPYYEDPPMNRVLLGEVIVGREMNAARVKDLVGVLSSEVAFWSGKDVIISSFAPLDQQEVEQQVAGGEPQQVQLGKKRFLATSVDLTPGVKPPLRLTVLKSNAEAAAALASLNHLLLGLGLIAVVAGGILAYLISDTFTKPLATLVRGVHALEQGNFTYPLQGNGGDEVAQVTRAFENMRRTLQSNEDQRRQLEDQLRQSQKMDALGRLAGGVAHDFNNLLTVIKGNSDIALDQLKPADPIYACCQQIKKVADRAAVLTRQLLAFSRKQVLQPKILDMNELIAEMSRLLRPLLREDIEFVVRLGESLERVQADPGQLEQVLLNLTVNASDAMPDGGKLTIETHNVHVDEEFARTHPPMPPGEYVMLAVTDSGHGMDAGVKARIFEPFFTTKEPGKGTGLGLATVYGVVKQSAGFIFVYSEAGHGTSFKIYLPQVDAAAVDVSAAAGAPVPRGAETVLLVEDAAAVRAVTKQMLERQGYTVLQAPHGDAALRLAQKYDGPIHMLLTDVVMPLLSGRQLAEQLARVRPDMKVLYASGYTDDSVVRHGILESGTAYLQKPFSPESLARKVREVLDSPKC